MRDFPVELVDMVLDYYADDKPSLSRFALVARSWVNGCRRHLFRCTSAVAEEDEVGFDRFAEFLSASPHVSRFIRTLRLCSTSVEAAFGEFLNDYCRESSDDGF